MTDNVQGGSNMTGTNCDMFTHKSSRSYLKHLVHTTLILTRVPDSLLPWKNNKYYIFVCLCVCVCERAHVCACVPERVEVCMSVRACRLAPPHFRHYLTNDTIFKKKLNKCIICALTFSKTLSKTFPILRII
jgi:hypothetical protein